MLLSILTLVTTMPRSLSKGFVYFDEKMWCPAVVYIFINNELNVNNLGCLRDKCS